MSWVISGKFWTTVGHVIKTLDMSKLSKSIIKKFDRRLRKYVDLEVSACGYESCLAEAEAERKKILKWLEQEVEKVEREVVK